MSEYDSRWDAIVIGSGLGGMATAAYLAAGGKKTLVLERHDVIGGSSQVFRRKKKWEFDCGVHYIGDCGPNGLVPTLLRGLGLDDRIEWLPLDPEAFDTIVGPDLELRVPVGWDRYLENLLAAFPREERGLRRYVATMKRLGAAFDRSRSPASLAAMRRSVSDAGWAGAWAMVPYAALLASCGLSPRTFLALSVQSGALSSIPQRIPTASQAAYLQDFVGGGAWYPRGGGQMLSAGFAKVVESQKAWVKRVVAYELFNGADQRLAYEHHFGKLEL
jgi:ferredoxin--NADP+ reductase